MLMKMKRDTRTHTRTQWDDEDDINGPMDIKPAYKYNVNWSHLIKKKFAFIHFGSTMLELHDYCFSRFSDEQKKCQ